MDRFKIINGINAEQLLQTIDLVKENPALAQFKFRTQSTWINGTHNRAMVKDFYGALKEDDTREPMVFDLDEPPILCGENKGANPVEYLLVALSGCLTTSLVTQAALKDITLEKISSRYEGDIDLQGPLGLSEEVPVGYQAIRVISPSRLIFPRLRRKSWSGWPRNTRRFIIQLPEAPRCRCTWKNKG